jgi:hypothetical protein
LILKRFIITIFLLFHFVDTFADTGFTFGNEIEFKFLRNGMTAGSPDSLSVLYHDGSQTDTVFIGKHRTEHYQNWLRRFEDGVYNMDGYVHIQAFKIVVYFDSTRYEIPYMKVFGGRNYFIFEIQENGHLKDKSPLFYVHWPYYFKALFLTILLEFIVVFLFFWLLKDRLWPFALTLAICNLLTHPMLWYICSHINISLTLLECMVAILETLVIWMFLKTKINTWKIILISFTANFTSWFLGGIGMAIWN